MITLKSKIIRNFVAGILACVLVFSILVTLFVTFNLRETLLDQPDSRPTQVWSFFKKYNNDPNVSIEDMWDGLGDLAKALEVDIYFEENNGDINYKKLGRDKNNTNPKKTIPQPIFNIERGIRTGTLYVVYNVNPEPTRKLQRGFATAIVYGLTISLAIGFIISLILSKNISEPIMTISDDTNKIRERDYDIAERDTDIIELEKLQNDISYLSKSLKNQEVIRKQYAQDISHELRTPLTNLQLYIEAIRDGVVTPDQNTMDVLLEDVNRLEGLIEGLKKTFDENVEHLEINNEDFNLSLLIERIVLTFVANAEKNNIKIHSIIDEEVYMYSDKDKISQILQNLISNSIKAIGSNGSIDVLLRDDFDKIIIQVIDDGVGIEEEKIDLIFERFYRIEDARNTKENGHGLGLSITKNFVEALDGQISVDSKAGEGAIFTVAFRK